MTNEAVAIGLLHGNMGGHVRAVNAISFPIARKWRRGRYVKNAMEFALVYSRLADQEKGDSAVKGYMQESRASKTPLTPCHAHVRRSKNLDHSALHQANQHLIMLP
jgi:hypothetical protein